ncbi:E3 ubiquitin-protein ligase MYLIP-like [Patiria miniata]|uniref:E3 ubiquitin-protein ligase MYLIP n=1 Tax=Patiria miniata TaxID=46514 RepID=A0A914BBX5_PATMI|nr:E3 ubiquitin-protein ligase MYLIP-like [Patiria miniata]
MWCFISESPYIVREYHLPKHSHGQILMDKVCDDVGLIEREYFGLRYRSKNGELLWLNLRNPLNLQLNTKPPHRLSLQVKFFVSPQELQQTISRHVYYMTLKNRLLQSHYKVDDSERLELCVLMAQAELGNDDVIMDSQYQCILPELSEHKLLQVKETHKNAETELTKSQSEIQFINKISKLPGYGVEYFAAETMDRTKVVIGVHSGGLQILSQEREIINNIKFEDISKVSYHQNRFSVHFYSPSEEVNEDDVVSIHKFRLTSRKSAQALFRAFTESHTFFRCENVERVVRQQHSHTGWGSLLALFRPHTNYGKIYRFDITKTRRQTYDNAWHYLHHDSSPPPQRFSVELDTHLANHQPYSTQTLRSTHSQEIMLSRQPSRASELRLLPIKSHREVNHSNDTTPEGTLRRKGSNDGPSRPDTTEAELVNSLQDELANIRDSHMCQVCLERDMATVFCPCGHMICCERCSPECFRCPVCRADVAYVQRVFFS